MKAVGYDVRWSALWLPVCGVGSGAGARCVDRDWDGKAHMAPEGTTVGGRIWVDVAVDPAGAREAACRSVCGFITTLLANAGHREEVHVLGANPILDDVEPVRPDRAVVRGQHAKRRGICA